MLKDLIANAAIIISCLSILGQLFRNRPLELVAPIQRKILAGALFGVLGLLLMQFGFQPTPVAVVDLRHLSTLVAAFYGGMYSALVSALVIALGRIFMFSMNSAAVTAALSMILIGIICGVLSKRLFLRSHPRFFLMNVCSLLIISLTLFLNVPDRKVLLELIMYHWIVSLLGGMLIYYIVTYIDQSNQLFRQLNEQLTKDFLTGVHNVRSFDAMLNESLQRAKDTDRPLALMVLDIDHFKKINDTYGHSGGDVILRELAALLRCLTRTQDFVSRNGGEEFTILMPETTYETGKQAAERIRAAIADHSFVIESVLEPVHVTTSIGVATYPQTATADELYQVADKALYQAKEQGRNQVC